VELANAIFDFLVTLTRAVMRPSLRLWPLYIITTLLIAFGLHARSGSNVSFLRWVFPSRVYRHPSNRTDIKLFFLGQGLKFFGFFKLVLFTSVVASSVDGWLDGVVPTVADLGPIPVGVAAMLALDFTVYWVHRTHHERSWLWPFHSVHHSAEVMTPMTVYRKHPVYDLISSFSKGILGGTMQGVLLAAFTTDYSVAKIAGINGIYFVFNIIGSNLRHSHIWLSYGPVLERIFISPAQHQVHHSIDPKHFNKNYGEVLAIWDWMFGTLYLTQSEENLSFGLSDGSGVAMEQPHRTLRQALSVPFADSWAAISGKSKADHQPERSPVG
jgi:sterol desaturase/sphingolipid hydroxylase (fatty acid hydroxylase superfamily)